jgi:hypothetical protein
MATAASRIPVRSQTLHLNPLGTVTADYVVIRDFDQHSHTIVALESISNITTVKTVRMPLMVFASASFIIAAAAQCSRDGGGAATPCALIGIVFLLAYLMSRRASVILSLECDALGTAFGTLGDAAKLRAAIHSAREQLSDPSKELGLESPQRAICPLLIKENSVRFLDNFKDVIGGIGVDGADIGLRAVRH